MKALHIGARALKGQHTDLFPILGSMLFDRRSQFTVFLFVPTPAGVLFLFGDSHGC
jgi:hypothetical protein